MKLRPEKLVVGAGVIALLALALMIWSVLDPTPLAVVGFMTIGQGLGTASLALFLTAVIIDLRRGPRRAEDRPE